MSFTPRVVSLALTHRGKTHVVAASYPERKNHNFVYATVETHTDTHTARQSETVRAWEKTRDDSRKLNLICKFLCSTTAAE